MFKRVYWSIAVETNLDPWPKLMRQRIAARRRQNLSGTKHKIRTLLL